MNTRQKGTAIATCVLGLGVLAIAGIVLVSQLREERATRQRLEKERVQLLDKVAELNRRMEWTSW